MPIKGLTDRGLSFPEIGQIRKGSKKQDAVSKSGKKIQVMGKDLPFFRVEFGEQEVAAATVFRQHYPERPVDINILLPFNEVDEVWQSWLEAYTAGRMVARSDGERYLYLIDTATGALLIKDGLELNGQPVPYVDGQPCGKDAYGKPVFCRPTGRLKVVIPELERLAFLTVVTNSVHDIVNISAQLQAIKTMNYGLLAGIPLILKRRPKMISTPDPRNPGQRVRREKWLISIEADPAWVRAAFVEANRRALPGGGMALPQPTLAPEPPALESGEPVYVDDEDDEYEGEYVPDAGDLVDDPGAEPEPVAPSVQEGVETGLPTISSEMMMEMADRFGVPYPTMPEIKLREEAERLSRLSQSGDTDVRLLAIQSILDARKITKGAAGGASALRR